MMKKPSKLREIHELAGRVAALSRFIALLGEKALPFYTLMRKPDKFEWNDEAYKAFEDLKKVLASPPVLVAPNEKELLLLYIAATHQVVSTILVIERSEVLSPSKQRYP
jgi:dsDNA-binding SOS-regulon protein